jgi:DNA-binding GntR family transcriptional regulator
MKEIGPIERPRTLMELAYGEIKSLLTTGRLQFDTIYSANHFAEILRVSRTPVREALLQLTAEGFLVSVQGRGFKIRGFSEKEIRDFFETRKMIETYIIEHLVDLLNEQDLENLNESCQRMRECTDSGTTNTFLEADKDFHMRLVHRYSNLFLESIMGDIRNLISIFGQKALSRSGRTREVIEEHERILGALRCKDKKEAVHAVLDHLETTEKYLFDHFNLDEKASKTESLKIG